MIEFSVRPNVADMLFQVFGRAVHPEHFEILASRTVDHQGYGVRVWITRTGHVICWRKGDLVLTETVHADGTLQLQQRLAHARIRNEHRLRVPLRPTLIYQSCFQVETLSPEVFQDVHEEIAADGCRRGMIHHLAPHQRIALSPIGFLNMEAKPGCLFFSSFHTFPEENTVLKTQSLLELGS